MAPRKKKVASLEAFKRLKQEEEWTTDEKQSLLDAMKEHGVNNMAALKAAVPSKTQAQLFNFLQLRKQEGQWRHPNPNYQPPLEQWLACFNAKDKQGGLNVGSSRELVKTMQAISKYEAHPPPEDCNGVDFKEMYNYLAQILQGVHPSSISAPSAACIHETCKWLAKLLEKKDFSEEKKFLMQVSVSPGQQPIPIKKTYGKSTRVEQSTSSASRIHTDVNYNPISVPEHLLLQNPKDLEMEFNLFKNLDVERQDDSQDIEEDNT